MLIEKWHLTVYNGSASENNFLFERKGERILEPKIIDIDDFIRRYEYLYFEPKSYLKNCEYRKYNSIEDYKKRIIQLGIHNLNGTDYNAEEIIVEKRLKLGKFDKIALAWKFGKIQYIDGKVKPTDDFKKEDNYIEQRGKQININAFEEYCMDIRSKQKSIIEYVGNENWEEAYKAVASNSPTYIGPVYNINSLFFLSAGKAPIYDQFVHKAVRSLLLGIAPSDVFVGGVSDKKEYSKVTVMYQEYILLVKKLFSDYINRDNMFIPRELDRALWVYGHSTKQYNMNSQ